jgi:hypothetical protein
VVLSDGFDMLKSQHDVRADYCCNIAIAQITYANSALSSCLFLHRQQLFLALYAPAVAA